MPKNKKKENKIVADELKESTIEVIDDEDEELNRDDEELTSEDDEEKITSDEIERAVKERAKKDFIRETYPYLIIIIAVVIIRTFIASPVRVNGSSMYPTLENGDNMILNKIGMKLNGISRFDIVVVNYKDETRDEKIIKRVIGLPGDRIKYEIEETTDGVSLGHLYINGELVEESFLEESAKVATCKNADTTICKDEYIVPEGEYFVMGDNRGDSLDSRIIGSVKYEDICGISEFIFFPFSRIGNAKK